MAGQLIANQINTDTGLFSTQNAYSGIAKAWACFTGSTGAITKSFNISSITRNSTGNYTVNFATAMADSNYVVACGSTSSGTSTAGGVSMSGIPTNASSFNFVFYVGASGYDAGTNCFAVFN